MVHTHFTDEEAVAQGEKVLAQDKLLSVSGRASWSPGLTLADPAHPPTPVESRQGSLTSCITVTGADQNGWLSSMDSSCSGWGARPIVQAERLYPHVHPLLRQNHLGPSQGGFRSWINSSILTSPTSENKIQFNLGRKNSQRP